MYDVNNVVDSFVNEEWVDGKWVLKTKNGTVFVPHLPEDYWFPDQVKNLESAMTYEHSTEFYRVWARIVLMNACAMVWAKAEKEYLSDIDKPKGKDFGKAEKAGAQAEQDYLKKVIGDA